MTMKVYPKSVPPIVPLLLGGHPPGTYRSDILLPNRSAYRTCSMLPRCPPTKINKCKKIKDNN